MKLAEKNANKMRAAVDVVALFSLLQHTTASSALESAHPRRIAGPDKNIRKRKLEAPPRSANLPGNLSRGSCTWLSRVMTQDTFYEIFI